METNKQAIQRLSNQAEHQAQEIGQLREALKRTRKELASCSAILDINFGTDQCVAVASANAVLTATRDIAAA